MPVSPPDRASNRADRATQFGVYVHWPFCKSKCPYCDFNSHVRAGIDQDRFLAAYLKDIEAQASRYQTEKATSLFFGGGTPSLMPPETVAAIVDAIDRYIGLEGDAEITLEANPTSVEAENFKGYALAGVNRVSLGVQALNDTDLKFLGREHSVAEACAAVELARKQFRRMSFDLIYARNGQTVAEWERELDQAVDMGMDHLSLYQLTIEPGTAFHRAYEKGRLATLDDDTAADLFLLTNERLQTFGLNRYEVSNHARLGEESRHNLTYWRYRPYLGIGPGAHGRVFVQESGQALATVEARTPEDWLQCVENQGHGIAEEEALTGSERAIEYLMMSLRLREGADLSRFSSLNGAPLDDRKIERLLEEKLLTRTESRIATTDRGISVLNAVLMQLLS